ncbi:MAG: hypothetical protein ACAH88_19195 [Roseimicrobium sp.]
MTSVIEYYSDTIITKSRGFLAYLTFGNWGRVCTLKLSQRTLEVRTLRPWNTTTELYGLSQFDAVDYSYRTLASATQNGVHYEHDEFTVGLRFSSTGKVLPVAVFHGGTSTPVGLGALIASLLPPSWQEGSGGTQDIESRSLANMLCQKMSLELAM